MKVRAIVTVDIDENAWATEFGLDSVREVRADVQDYIDNLVKTATYEYVKSMLPKDLQK